MFEPEPEEDVEDEPEKASPLMEAAQTAFPDQEWDEDRLAGLKELLRLCSGTSYDEDDEDMGPPKKKPGTLEVAIFGPGKKAKK